MENSHISPQRPTNYDHQAIVLEKTKEFVRKQLEGEGTGHDWWHIYRVHRLACSISATEKADLYIVELAALLHDIADWKFHNGDETAGPRIARKWLHTMGVEEHLIEHVCDIIATLSFKGAGVQTPMTTIEGMIVQDADRLDALDAIGIARCFAYGGSRNGQVIHDPTLQPHMHSSFAAYKTSRTTSINHFYEKLLLLKERMNTITAKNIAEKRHHVMKDFLDIFHLEWEGAR